MSLTKRLISYGLPIVAIGVIPLLIMYFSKFRIDRSLWMVGIGVVVMIIGILLLASTIMLIEKTGKGTLATWSATSELVIAGPYRYMRNPMIFGVVTAIVGLWLITWNQCILAWLFSFLWATQYILNILRKKG